MANWKKVVLENSSPTLSGLVGDSTNFDIYQTSSDASDNRRTRIGGGGDVITSRGAYIELAGNEHSNTGQLILNAGDVTGGDIIFKTDNTTRLTIDDTTGKADFNQNHISNWNSLQAQGGEFNIDNGGYIDVLGTKDLTFRTTDSNTTRLTIKSAGDVSFTGWIEGNGENALYSNTSTGLLIQAPDTTEEIHFRDKNGSVGMLYNAGNKRLGVGTDSPDYPLHVHGSSDGIGYVKISDSNTGQGDTDGARIGFNSGVMRIQNFENSDMEFYVNNTTKPLVLESDGKATFSGDVTVERASADTTFKVSRSDQTNIQLVSAGMSYVRASAELALQSNGANTALTLDTSQNATFAGNINLSNNKSINFNNTSGTAKSILAVDSSNITKLGDNSNSGVLQLNAGAATFSGTVQANTGSKITSASADTTFSIETTSGTTIFPVLDLVSSHSSVGGKIRQGGSDVISFDKSQNATFSGNATATNFIATTAVYSNSGVYYGSSTTLYLKDSGGNEYGNWDANKKFTNVGDIKSSGGWFQAVYNNGYELLPPHGGYARIQTDSGNSTQARMIFNIKSNDGSEVTPFTMIQNGDIGLGSDITNNVTMAGAVLKIISGASTFSGDVQAPGIYVGSTNTSYDFYNNGTTYLNGATTIDADTSITGQAHLVATSGNSWTALKTSGAVEMLTSSADSSEKRFSFAMGGASDSGTLSLYNGDGTTVGTSISGGDANAYFSSTSGKRLHVGTIEGNAGIEATNTSDSSDHLRLKGYTLKIGKSAEDLVLDSDGNATFGAKVGIGVDATSDFEIKMATDKHMHFSDSQGETGNCPTIHAVNTAGSANVDLGFRGSNLIFATGSAERMRTTDTGLGIGVTPSYKLDVAGTARVGTTSAGGTLRLEGKGGLSYPWKLETGTIGGLTFDSNTTDVLTLRDSGRVGVGTTNPSARLHVKGDGAEEYIIVESTDSGDGIATLQLSTDGGAWLLQNKGTQSDNLVIRRSGVGDYVVVDTSGNVGIGTTSPSFPLHVSTSTAGRGLYVAQTYGTGTVYGGMIEAEGSSTTNIGLLTKASGATNNYGLIVSAGSVGIGETSPSYKLDIIGDYSNPSATAAATAVVGISAAASGSELVIGGEQNGGKVWIQNRHKSVNGYAYEIAFQPQGGTTSFGGPVGLGATPSTYHASADNFVIYESGNAGMTIATSSTGTGSIFFADSGTGDEAYKGAIEYVHGSTNELQFRANSVKGMTLDASKNLTIFGSYLNIDAGGTNAAITCNSDTMHFIADTNANGGTHNPFEWWHDSDTIDGGTKIMHLSSGADLWIGNDLTVTGSTTTNGLTITNKILHDGDTGTYLAFTNGQIDLKGSGGVRMMLSDNEAIYFYTGSSTTQALHLDTSQNATFSGNVSVGDGDKVGAGADTDIWMTHSTHSYIENKTGEMRIVQGSGDHFSIWTEPSGGSDTKRLNIAPDGVVTIYGNTEIQGTITLDTGEKLLSAGGYVIADGDAGFIARDSGSNKLIVNGNTIKGDADGVQQLGQSDVRWANIYSVLGDFSGNVTISSTDAGAGANPTLTLTRNSASPDTNDLLGIIEFKGEDTMSASETYADITGKIGDPTHTGEDGVLRFRTMQSGTLGDAMYINQRQIQAANGSVSTPSYGFWNDADTGMYSSEVGSLNFTTAGTQALTFNSSQTAVFSGDVYIPMNLVHSGDGNNYIGFQTDRQDFVTDGTTALTIDSAQTAIFYGKIVRSATNNSAGTAWTVIGDGNIPHISIQNASTTNDTMAGLFFKDDQAHRAGIHAKFLNHTDGSEQAQLVFSTANSGNTRERMTIAHDGDVTIVGSTNYSQLRIKGAGDESGIKFIDSGGTTDGFIYAQGTDIGFLQANGSWKVRHANSLSQFYNQVNITSGALVVTAPSSTAAYIYIQADNNANHSDNWRLSAETDNMFDIQSRDGGSWASVVEWSASDKAMYAKGNVYLSGTTLSLAGNASTDSYLRFDGTGGDTYLHYNANDMIDVYTGGDIAMRIKDDDVEFNGGVQIDGITGIGNSSADSFYYSKLVVGDGSGEENLTIYAGSSDHSGLFFADSTSGNGRFSGQIYYNHDTNKMKFATNYSGASSYALEIDSSQNSTFTGDLTVEGAIKSNSTEVVSSSGQILHGHHGYATRIKVLPFDFIPNDDNSGDDVVSNDGESEVGKVNVTNQAIETHANYDIPRGYKVTHCMLYGSNSGNVVKIYEANIDDGDAVEKGVGNIGTEIDCTDFNASSTNYVVLKWAPGATSDFLYGGYITIATI